MHSHTFDNTIDSFAFVLRPYLLSANSIVTEPNTLSMRTIHYIHYSPVRCSYIHRVHNLLDNTDPGVRNCTTPRLVSTTLEYITTGVVSLPYSKVVNVYEYIYHHLYLCPRPS